MLTPTGTAETTALRFVFRCCTRWGKPLLLSRSNDIGTVLFQIQHLVDARKRYYVLNVVGSREEDAPGVYDLVSMVLNATLPPNGMLDSQDVGSSTMRPV